jgi:hypothetical protein
MNGRPSITFTALIWLGMILAVAGAVVVVLGVGGAVNFSLKASGIELKSTSTGLALCAIGCLLAGGVATRLPPGVAVLGGRATFMGWMSRHAWWVLAVGVVIIVLLFLSLR